jgi:HSP20 family protein
MPALRAGIAPRFEDLRDEFDRLWTSLSAGPPVHDWTAAAPAEPAGLFPAVNVAETDESIMIEAELPGLEPGDVEISVAGEQLVLRGSRPSCGEQPAGNGEKPASLTWHRRERGSGEFERRIELPVPVDAARVEARLIDGVLTVTCPKAPQAQPRKVTVRSA